MRAAIVENPLAMSVGEWKTPRPEPGEILVQVAAAGVCASDVYIYQGKNPYAVYPQVLGHEVSGTISEVGSGVDGFAPGDHVVVEPFIGCGRCYPCRVGKSNCCMNLRIIGIHQPGGYADYLTAPAALVHRVPEGVPLALAAFAEPVAIAVQGCRRGAITAADRVLVLGCGPIGMALIEVARARGAAVMAADLNPERLAIAAQLGADTFAAGSDLLNAVLQATDGEGAPVVMEATGSVPALESTVDLVAAGGRIVLLGVFKRGVTVSLPALDFTRKEMSVLGSRCSVRCFPEALQLLASGAITYPKVATRFGMWDAPRVFQQINEKPESIHKALLVRDENAAG